MRMCWCGVDRSVGCLDIYHLQYAAYNTPRQHTRMIPIFVLVGTLSVQNIMMGIDISAISARIDTAVFLSASLPHLLDCCVRVKHTLIKPWRGLICCVAQAFPRNVDVPDFLDRTALNEINNGNVYV